MITLLLFSLPVAAQDRQSEKWYWGWDSNTHELFAYSENGETNLLLTDVLENVDYSWYIWRVSEDRAIALIHTSNQLALYSIGSIKAEKLVTELNSQAFEPFISRQNGLRLEAYQYPYMVLSTWYSLDKKTSRPAFLVNLAINTVGYLNDSVALGFCCRFTPDGHSLRYITSDGGYESPSITLHERALDTGIEKVLYTDASGNAESDKNGERWLFPEGENGLSQYRIFDVSTGTGEVIYQRDPAEYYSDYDFVDDDLISYQPLCETDCTLQLEAMDGDTYLYTLPDTHGGSSIYSFDRLTDNKLIIGRPYDYWLLSVDTPPKFIGYVYSDGVGPITDSPDGRFSVISDTENYPQMRRMIIDWKTLEILLTLTEEPESLFEATYNQEGFLINPLDNRKGIMYRYANREVIRLPEKLQGNFFDILPDGSVLYQTSASTNPQISRYFPQSDETKLLVDGLLNIPTIDVTNYAYP
ncbi:MAG: hypothetical protein ABI690_15290 [Chloroflexota bacterium]